MTYLSFIYTFLVKLTSLKNKTTILWLSLFLAFSFMGIVGCSPSIPVTDKTVDIEISRLVKSTEFNSPVWLPSQKIALINNEREHRKVWAKVFDLEDESWQLIPFEDFKECVSTRFDAWQRLSDGRLGFIYECRDEKIELTEVGHYLIAWDEVTNKFEILRGYDRSMSPYGFAVSPEFKYLFQEAGGDV